MEKEYMNKAEENLIEFLGVEFPIQGYKFENGEKVDVVIRPEDLDIVPKSQGKLKGIVKSVLFKGVHYEILVKENDRMWMLHNTKSAEVGSELGMDIYPEDIHIMRKVDN